MLCLILLLLSVSPLIMWWKTITRSSMYNELFLFHYYWVLFLRTKLGTCTTKTTIQWREFKCCVVEDHCQTTKMKHGEKGQLGRLGQQEIRAWNLSKNKNRSRQLEPITPHAWLGRRVERACVASPSLVSKGPTYLNPLAVEQRNIKANKTLLILLTILFRCECT